MTRTRKSRNDSTMIETITTKEETGNRLRPHIELGNHSGSEAENMEVLERYMRGDASAHIWNREVTERVSKYQPTILTIDSVEPGGNSAILLHRAWLNLPDRPRHLNKSGTIQVVRGDVVDLSMFINSPQPSFTEIPAEVLIHEQREVGARNANVLWLSANIPTLLLAVPTGLALFGAYGDSVSALSQETPTTPRRLTRRSFLRAIGTATGVLLATHTLGYQSPAITAQLSDQRIYDRFLSMSQLLRPRLIQNDLANLRTALLIEKNNQACSEMGVRLDKSALVVGNYHGYEASKLLEDKEYRARVIKTQSKVLIQLIITAMRESGYSQEQQDKARVDLGKCVASYDIATFIDPGDPPYGHDLPTVIAQSTKISDFQICRTIQMEIES